MLIIVLSGQKFAIDLYSLENESSEYISSDKTVILYLLTILAISSRFSQICPEGLLGEFINNK